MSTVLRIKRSNAATTATPALLKPSELAYSEGTSTYTDTVANSNVASHGKLYYGRGVDANGDANSIDIIGGKYFTDLLDHGHGTLTANSALIVDSTSKIDVLNVDNITLNGNTISTTNSNGDLTVDTNGTGDVVIAGAATLGTNLFKITDGSTDRLVVDSFSGAIDIVTPSLSSADTALSIGATWNNASATFYGIDVDVTNSASDSTSRLLNLSVGGSDKFNIDLSGNIAMHGGITFVNETNFDIKDNTTDAFTVKEDTNKYIDIDTNNGSELITFGTANVDIDNDLNIDGGDLTTNQSTFNLLETNATTVNAFGSATAIDVGATTGTFTLNNPTLVGTQTTQNVFNSTATTVNAFGAGTDINIGASGAGATTFGNNTVDGTETTQNVFNTTATTVNAFGAATGLNMGANTGTMTIGNPTVVGTQTTQNLYNTTATTVNAFGAAATLNIGAAAGTTTLRSGTLVGTETTQNVFNATATTVNFAGAATTIAIGASGAHTTTLGSGTLVGTQTTQNVFDATATTVNAFGAATTVNMGTASTTLDLGNIRIKGNTISTDSNAATELIIDPFPDAGDAGGDVIIRGNLQVAGTTTTVNSTEMAVNDPVFTIGDTVTEKTVKTSAAVANPQLLEIDNPSGVVESATITGTNINSSTVVGNIRIEFNTASTPLSGNPSAGDDIYLYDGTSFSLLGDFVSKTADTVTIDLASNISTRGDDFYNGKSLSSVGIGTLGLNLL